jgi:ATPase subunit of ABC transporter with duplicated ATPase domains
LEEVKPSSRANPFIRFDLKKKLHRLAVEAKNLSKAYDKEPLFKNFNLAVEAGERIAIIGGNGVGKTTLLRCLYGDLVPDTGIIKWSENVNIGYFAQDHAAEFNHNISLFQWMCQWMQEGDDEQTIRGILGRLLFSKDESQKSIKVVSGGEQARLLFGKLMLLKPNVLLMDEPTNHLDMESIESLNTALENYPGTLLFISHDREFVSSLATRIWEITPRGIVDYVGSYEDYLLQPELLLK